MKRVLIFLIVSGLFVLFTGCGAKTTESVVKDALVLAKNGDQGSWEEALQKIESCIKKGVTDPEIINFYILCLYRTGNKEKAMDIAREQLSELPGNFTRNFLIGKMHFENGEFRRAYNHLVVCRRSKSDHVESLVLMAKCAGQLKLPNESQLYLELLEMDQFKSSFLALNALACSYVEIDQIPYAVSSFSSALKQSNGHPLVYLNMAILNDVFLNNDKIAQRFYLNFLYKSKDRYPAKSQKVLARLQTIGSESQLDSLPE